MGKTIEVVPTRKQHQAVRFLIGGSRQDELVDAQAHNLERQMLAGRSDSSHLWWTRSWRQCLAAALVFENVGRTGMLLASPAEAPGVDVEMLIELLRKLGSFALDKGLSMVQSLLPPEAQPDKNVLERAGFMRLAQLTYMNWDLSRFEPSAPPTELEMIEVPRCGEAMLAEVIKASYRQSMDCPALEGVRQIADVIAGHKASGVYRPESWWIAMWSGAPGGCLLLNDNPISGAADVIYLGVAPEFRGRGLGRAMLQHAARDIRRRGYGNMTLAVDAANRYAVAIYQAAGFKPLFSRDAYVLLKGKSQAPSVK
jgi:GNAT superfamily N-acetyltransferase